MVQGVQDILAPIPDDETLLGISLSSVGRLVNALDKLLLEPQRWVNGFRHRELEGGGDGFKCTPQWQLRVTAIVLGFRGRTQPRWPSFLAFAFCLSSITEAIDGDKRDSVFRATR